MIARTWIMIFALLASVPGAADANPSAKLQNWLSEPRCAAFTNLDFLRLPVVRRPAGDMFIGLDRLRVRHDATTTLYDPAHRIALTIDANFGAVELWRTGPPPVKVESAKLAGVRLKSGVRIGSRETAVRAILGKPFARSACGETEFSYAVDRLGTQLIVTLRRGRVTAIEFMPSD